MKNIQYRYIAKIIPIAIFEAFVKPRVYINFLDH